MNARTRIALNAFLPPLIGAFFVAAHESILHSHTLVDIPLTTIAIALYAWIIAAFPCALHAIAMEVVYRYAQPCSLRAVLASTLSGFLAGIFLGYAILPVLFQIPSSAFYPVIGLLTGCLLGGLLALVERRIPSKPVTT